MKLNLGSGPDYREGWLNVDCDSEERADLYADVRDHEAILAAVGDASVELVYMKHVLEHFSIADVPDHLAWCFRTLRPGGHLVIDGPDLRAMCKRLALKPAWTWADVEMIYGGQKSRWDYHQSGWGPDFLRTLLTEAGFVHVQCQPVDLCFIMGAQKPEAA